MARNLVIFTENYPWPDAECFFAEELVNLAKNFNKITLIARTAKGLGPPKVVPGNVVVVGPVMGVSPTKIDKLRMGIFNRAPFLDILLALLKEKPWGLRKIAKAVHVFLTARALLGDCALKKFFNSENTSFYFYWGSGSAFVIPFLKKDCEVIVKFHSIDLYKHRQENGGYIPLQQAICERANKIITISRNGYDYLASQYQFVVDKTSLIRMGTYDFGMSMPSSDGIFRLLSCSSMIEIKNLGFIADALSHTKRKILWTHIGDGPCRSALEKKVAALPQGVDVCFTGSLARNEVFEFYKNNCVDLFINVSHMEGLPVSIMEALSAGVPVFSRNVGGISDLVDDCVGKLLPSDPTSSELMTEIEKFMSLDIDTAKTYRNSARQRWFDLVNADIVYNELVNLFKT